jgi:hypothetical protein
MCASLQCKLLAAHIVPAVCSSLCQNTKPIFIRENYKGADKLKGKVAIITGVCQGRRSKSVVSWHAAALRGALHPRTPLCAACLQVETPASGVPLPCISRVRVPLCTCLMSRRTLRRQQHWWRRRAASASSLQETWASQR